MTRKKKDINSSNLVMASKNKLETLHG